MRPRSYLLFTCFAVVLCVQAKAAPFVIFPKAQQLASPDGHFIVRNVDAGGSASEFVGTFHSLWLTEVSTGASRKLCDYLGVAAVAWSDQKFLVVTQYVGKKTSRTLVFAARDPDKAALLDAPTLIQLVPTELRSSLRGNDHIFIEGSDVDGDTLHLTVWGYGAQDPNGFRWNCQYAMSDARVQCAAKRP